MNKKLESLFSISGNFVLLLSKPCGEIAILLYRTFFWIFKSNTNKRNFFLQLQEMGARTFPVTSLTLLFTGMVLALQTGYAFIRVFNEPLYVGRLVSASIVKELGPVMTAVVFSGRVGAAVAAELGTMKVTEQIDALYTLGTNPVKYLVVPRFLAAMIMLPLLVIYSDFLGTIGGYLVAHYRFDIPTNVYFDEVYLLRLKDVFHGLVKSFAFALLVIMVACYRGLNTEGGAEGVGRATTQSVVVSMVLILVGDYFLTALLIAFGLG